jgi:copper chaperone CopZ
MTSLVLDVPAMYADHHVVEVRRLLLADAGVASVDASSAFHVVEIEFDPDRTSADDLRAVLDEAGYTGDLPSPQESGDPAIRGQEGSDGFFRHSTAYAPAGRAMSFGQDVISSGRPLYPCPGMAPAPAMDDPEDE